MIRLQRISLSLLIALALSLPGLAFAQMYSWTDEDGNVHYGDSIPPEYRDQESRELRDGVEVDRVERAPTEEELRERRLQQELAEEAARAAELQARDDRRLLSLYGSVSEIERLRDDRIEGLRSQIRLTAANLEELEQNLERVEENLDRYEDRGEEPPEHLLSRYEDLSRQVGDHQRHLMEREDQLEHVRTRFNAEIDRFTELQEERGR